MGVKKDLMGYANNKHLFMSKFFKVIYSYDDEMLNFHIYPLRKYYPNLWLMFWLWGFGFCWSGKKEYWIIKGFGKGWNDG